MIPAHLRRKRIWNVADFAEFTGLSHKAAKSRLKTYNDAMSGMLLIPSRGANREYTFIVAQLAKAFPDLFESIESLEMRVDEVEDAVDDLRMQHRIVVNAVGQMTRDIAKIRTARKAA